MIRLRIITESLSSLNNSELLHRYTCENWAQLHLNLQEQFPRVVALFQIVREIKKIMIKVNYYYLAWEYV